MPLCGFAQKSHPLDTLEVGEHEDAEEFGASGLGHRVEARL